MARPYRLNDLKRGPKYPCIIVVPFGATYFGFFFGLKSFNSRIAAGSLKMGSRIAVEPAMNNDPLKKNCFIDDSCVNNVLTPTIIEDINIE